MTNSVPAISPGDTVNVTDWRPAGVEKCIAASSRNFVGLLEDGHTVLKYPHRKSSNAVAALHEEAARYTHIGPHPNIVRFKGTRDDGVLFEYCERGQLSDFISKSKPLTTYQKISLAKQIIQGLTHLHQSRYIHCDLNVDNVFVTKNFDAKIGDLQGQLYGPDCGIILPTMSQENAKSRHPEAGDDEFTARTDIFALGTLLYHLWYEHPPFPDLDEYSQEEKIQARYKRREFPISQSKYIDSVIIGCWTSTYTSASEVFDAIEGTSVRDTSEL